MPLQTRLHPGCGARSTHTTGHCSIRTHQRRSRRPLATMSPSQTPATSAAAPAGAAALPAAQRALPAERERHRSGANDTVNPHIRKAWVQQECTLLQAVCEVGGVDAARAQELIDLGAVYLGDEIKGQGTVKWRRLTPPPPNTQPASQTQQVAAGQLLRVHPKPKRFPACQTTHWPSQLVHEDADYVVMNKPAGIMSMRHESNGVEHAAECMSRALGLGPLQTCHRLDCWTTGVLVMGRHKAAVARFNQALSGDRASSGDDTANSTNSTNSINSSNNQHGSTRSSSGGSSSMTKRYKTLTRVPVPLGTLEHWMYNGPFGEEGIAAVRGHKLLSGGPRLLSSQPLPGFKRCKLVVEACEALNSPSAQAWMQASFGAEANDTAAVDAITEATAPATAVAAAAAAVQADAGAVHAEQRRVQQMARNGAPPHGGSSGNSTSCCDSRDCVQGLPGEALANAASAQQRLGSEEGTSTSSTSDIAANVPLLHLYESTVLLVTGRTHQIRAQLAAIGAPLVADSTYGVMPSVLLGPDGLIAEQDLPAVMAATAQGGPIGLHAWQLVWQGGTYTAPPPWTRRECLQ